MTTRRIAAAAAVLLAPLAFTLLAVAGPAQATVVYYRNCDAVRAAGKAPLHRGDPGYRPGLDTDNDGIACEYWSSGKPHPTSTRTVKPTPTGTVKPTPTKTATGTPTVTASPTVTATPPVTPSGPPTLPKTGPATAAIIGTGGVLLVGGAISLLTLRRRNHRFQA